MNEHAVVIVGGGPTGLMLAGELALAGGDVAIVEQRSRGDLIGSHAGGLLEQAVQRQACFMVGANGLDPTQLSAEALAATYKDQGGVERDFRLQPLHEQILVLFGPPYQHLCRPST
jgi:2-polyprenyl-6-methoxyphenol hydroxylase-like FAD-dependent oxidoreductase